jgi:hypothetical protein
MNDRTTFWVDEDGGSKQRKVLFINRTSKLQITKEKSTKTTIRESLMSGNDTSKKI